MLAVSQRRLADGVFDAASQKVRDMVVPFSQFPVIGADTSREEILECARSRRLDELPVFHGETPIGYVRAIDLELAALASVSHEDGLPIRDFVEIDDDYSPLAAMALFQSTRESLGCVVEQGKNVCIGVLHSDRLRDLLMKC